VAAFQTAQLQNRARLWNMLKEPRHPPVIHGIVLSAIRFAIDFKLSEPGPKAFEVVFQRDRH
jgi:hypothetical protein